MLKEDNDLKASLFPENLFEHINNVKKFTLDEIVKKEVRLYGIALVNPIHRFYFIKPLEDYEFKNKDFFCIGRTTVSNRTTVSFILRSKEPGKYFADNVFIVVDRRNN